MPGFNPYFALAGAIALIAAAAGGFIKGEEFTQAKTDQAALHQLANALQERDTKQKTIEGLETAAAQRETARQTEVREVYREIPQVITHNRVVYDRTCVDDPGVKLLDRAQAAAAGAGGEHSLAPVGEAGRAAEGPAHR